MAFSIHAKAMAEGAIKPRKSMNPIVRRAVGVTRTVTITHGMNKGKPMTVNAGGDIRSVTHKVAKPIGTGRNAGTTRSMKQGTDIQTVFKSKMAGNAFHHWTR